MKRPALNLTRLHIDIAGAAVAIVVTVLAYWVTLRPLAEGRAAAKDTAADVARLRADMTQREVRQHTLAQEMQQFTAELEAVDRILEPATAFNQRLADVVDLSADIDLEVLRTEAGSVRSRELCDIVPITVGGLGSFPDCVTFLHRLHERFPDVEVVSIELTGTPSPHEHRAQFEMELSWYAAASDERR